MSTPESLTAPSWPSAPPGSPGLKIGFPGAHEVATPSRRITHHALVLVLLAGFGAAILVVVVLFATPGPAPYCNPLKCQGPPVGHPGTPTQSDTGPPIESGTLYTSPQGFSLRYVPLPNVQTTSNGIDLTYSFTSVGAGELDVFGFSAGRSSDQTLVDQFVAQNFPNARPVYQMPDPLIGYHPAVGEAFNVTPTSSDGTTRTYRALVAAATDNGFAIVVVALGPLLPTVNTSSRYYNDHPSPANVYMAYFYGTDSLLNSITFPVT